MIWKLVYFLYNYLMVWKKTNHLKKLKINIKKTKLKRNQRNQFKKKTHDPLQFRFYKTEVDLTNLIIF
jgi:hypothetical protein